MKHYNFFLLYLHLLCSTVITMPAALNKENDIFFDSFISLKGKNAYTVLGLVPEATDQEIKKAYRKLVQRLHPDKNKGNEESAEAAFKIVAEAYNKIASPGPNRQYEKIRFTSGDSRGVSTSTGSFTQAFDFMDRAKLDEFLAAVKEEEERLVAEREASEHPNIRDSKLRVLAAQEKNKERLVGLQEKQFDVANETDDNLFILITYGGDYRAEAKLKNYLNLLIQGGGSSDVLMPLITQEEQELGKSYPVTPIAAVRIRPGYLHRLSFPAIPVPLRMRVWAGEYKPEAYLLRDTVFGTPDDAKKNTLAAVAISPEKSLSVQFIKLKKLSDGKVSAKIGYNT